MVGIKEILAVVTGSGEAGRHQGSQKFARMLGCGPAELAHDGVVDTDLVVFDVVAIDFDAGFVVFVGDGEMFAGQGFQGPIADPLLQHGELEHEFVIVGAGVGRHDHGDLFMSRFDAGKGRIENGVQAGENAI